MAHSASPLRCLTLQLKLKTVPNRTPNILSPLYPQFSPLKLTANILESPSTPFFLSLLTSNTSENPIGSKICSGSDHFSSPLPTPQCCDHFGPDQSFYNGLLTGLSASAVSSFRLFSTQEVVLVYWNVSQTQVLTRAYVALPDLPLSRLQPPFRNLSSQLLPTSHTGLSVSPWTHLAPLHLQTFVLVTSPALNSLPVYLLGTFAQIYPQWGPPWSPFFKTTNSLNTPHPFPALFSP